MSSSSSSRTRRVRILRGVDGDQVEAASVALELPNEILGRSVSVADQLEAARRSGYDEGFRAALAEQEARNETQRHIQFQRVADAIVEAAGGLSGARAEAVEVVASDAVTLAFELAEVVLQRELVLSRYVASDALARAITLVPSGQDIVVRLHPGEMIDAVDLQLLVPDSAVRVVADGSVESGGCIVEAGPCRIDAQIGSALERARELIDSLTANEHPSRSGAESTKGSVAPPKASAEGPTGFAESPKGSVERPTGSVETPKGASRAEVRAPE